LIISLAHQASTSCTRDAHKPHSLHALTCLTWHFTTVQRSVFLISSRNELIRPIEHETVNLYLSCPPVYKFREKVIIERVLPACALVILNLVQGSRACSLPPSSLFCQRITCALLLFQVDKTLTSIVGLLWCVIVKCIMAVTSCSCTLKS